ncbi:MAG: hypothetical protein JJ959_03815 [Nisaea sp.]|jgi:hypothetical protein|uniref:hypothetical protein n=1 Tax=Nisaea sp. TaxID=2024842 RepID=UPI001B13AE69|nr:hypothetical protein [Nisaea sp.]MBO6559633.1 hypothetical protein [Nisaea sp.]
MHNALYLLLHGAGGLTHDVTIWKEFARNQPRRRSAPVSVEESSAQLPGLGDAAVHLRRLSRQAKLSAQESQLLRNALKIVETEAAARQQPA